MIKRTITYVDFNDQTRTEDAYFNLSKTEVFDLFELMPRLEVWQERAKEAPRSLTENEIRDFLDIMKRIVELSYGVRSEDGRRFMKSLSIYEDFKSSPAYDEFLFSLFLNGGKDAQAFMEQLIPQDLVAVIQEASAKADAEQKPELTAVQEEVPAWIREDRDPTQAELQSMSQEQLRAAFQRKTSRS